MYTEGVLQQCLRQDRDDQRGLLQFLRPGDPCQECNSSKREWIEVNTASFRGGPDQ